MEKSLHNTTANGATKNVKDIQFWGDGDMFKLLSKASSEKEGWMKSTKALQIDGVGCIVQVTTQQRSGIAESFHDHKRKEMSHKYVIAEALTFVPNVMIEEQKEDDVVISRRLIAMPSLKFTYKPVNES